MRYYDCGTCGRTAIPLSGRHLCMVPCIQCKRLTREVYPGKPHKCANCTMPRYRAPSHLDELCNRAYDQFKRGR